MFKHVAIGRFVPGDSPVHKLDARVKLVLGIAFAVVVFLVRSWFAFAILTAYVFIAIALSQMPAVFVFNSLRPVLIVIAFTSVLHLLFTPGTHLWSWGPLVVTREGIEAAALFGFRLLLLLVGLQAITWTTAPLAMTSALEWLLKPGQRIGIPAHEIALMMTIALAFIPILVDELERIVKAQTARGADFTSGGFLRKLRALVPVLIPLFVSVFRRADDLSVAMESRGYRGAHGRTQWRQQPIGIADYAVLGASLVLMFWIGWRG